MPRKLVRGQDVWLGRGEQQTKDILKCMWCGESFRSLDLMTKHMQETKHYTKVISQEQLVSWKSTDGAPPGNGQPPAASATAPPPPSGSAAGGNNHVNNSILTCKVCEQSFSSLKDLSDHMIKNNHYKEPGSGPAAPAGTTSPASASRTAPSPGSNPRNNIQPTPPTALPPSTVSSGPPSAKEKRKKSLPVRKLLELERAQQEMSGQFKPHNPLDDPSSAGKISCEKCGEKILMHLFVDHIRQCVGPLPISRPLSADMGKSQSSSARTPSVSPPSLIIGGRKRAEAPTTAAAVSAVTGGAKEEPKSILGSLEKMVQSNFGAKKKPGPESNMSILQRLGIDEGVDYSKPLVDPMAMFRPPQGVVAAAGGPGGAASLAAGLAGFFGPMRASAEAAALAAQQAAQKSAAATRSNSECSSPDRGLFKVDKSVSPALGLPPKSPDSVKSNPVSPPKGPEDLFEEKKDEDNDEDVPAVSPRPKNITQDAVSYTHLTLPTTPDV